MLRYTWRDAAQIPNFESRNGFIGQQINCRFPLWHQPLVPAVSGQGVVLGEFRNGQDLKAVCILPVRNAEASGKTRFFRSDVFMPRGFANRERSNGLVECSKLHVFPFSREFIQVENPFIRKLERHEIGRLMEGRAYALSFMPCENTGLLASDIPGEWAYHGPVFDVRPRGNAFTPDTQSADFQQIDWPEMDASNILRRMQIYGMKKPISPPEFYGAVAEWRDPFVPFTPARREQPRP